MRRWDNKDYDVLILYSFLHTAGKLNRIIQNNSWKLVFVPVISSKFIYCFLSSGPNSYIMTIILKKVTKSNSPATSTYNAYFFFQDKYSPTISLSYSF